ncbi:hypothetical protein LB505_013696 [Fusarium chuoi]|nr:hypothetical protein LB505_013696 [Fusarium chuoi]
MRSDRTARWPCWADYVKELELLPLGVLERPSKGLAAVQTVQQDPESILKRLYLGKCWIIRPRHSRNQLHSVFTHWPASRREVFFTVLASSSNLILQSETPTRCTLAVSFVTRQSLLSRKTTLPCFSQLIFSFVTFLGTVIPCRMFRA